MTQIKSGVVRIGESELIGSRIGIGTWAIGGGWGPQPEEQSLTTLHQALEMGCRLIDTAALYGNGRAERLIAHAFKEYGSRVTTITKIYPFNYHWSPSPGTAITAIYPKEHILSQVEGSLRRLETDCLDAVLFQTWCPSWSDETTWYETMHALQQTGKIRTFGISVSDHRTDEANGVIEAGRVKMVEAPYSLLDQRAAIQLFPLAKKHGISIIARTPLASGALTGTWHEGIRFHRQDWRKRVFRRELLQETLQRVSRFQSLLDPKVSLTHIALQFCLSHPTVTAVIPGVRRVEQVQCNLAALESTLLPSDMLTCLTDIWQQEMSERVRTSIGKEGEG